MNFGKFKLYQTPSEQYVEEQQSTTLLLNLDQLVSVKPIRIAHEGEVVQAFWIRLTNGKKYKAIEIPDELKEMLIPELPPIMEEALAPSPNLQ